MCFRPDPLIQVELRSIDPKLELKWSSDFERWEVWHSTPLFQHEGEYKGIGLGSLRDHPYLVFRWETDDGRYMSPDMRIVAKMRLIWAMRERDYRKVLVEMRMHNRQLRDTIKKELLDEIEYEVGAHYNQLHRIISEDLGITGEKSPERMSKVYMNGTAA